MNASQNGGGSSVRSHQSSLSEGLLLHFGCQYRAPTGWVNFDASPTLVFERVPLIGRLYTRNTQRFPRNVRYGDIVKGLPLAGNSCAAVFCSHVLEHLALDDCETALCNTHSYLKTDGIFRLVVPDLERMTRDYLCDDADDAAGRFMEATWLGQKRRHRGMSGLVKTWLGNAAHLWMWDEKAMRARLQRHGFRDIRRAELGDSEDTRFNEVEEAYRFHGSLAMQCRK